LLRFIDSTLTRREWLRIGTLAGLGLTAPAPAGQRHSPGFGKAKSVLIIFASGGQSQLDTWDPKPDAPEEVRGIFHTIATRTAGVRVCEHLPKLARLSDRYCLLRTISHDDLDHGSACYLALTGRFHPRKSSNPPPRPDDYPTMAAVVRRMRHDVKLPYPAVHLNGPLLVPEVVSPGQYGGLLGRAYEPLTLGDVRDSAAELRGLEPRDDLPAVRVDRRRSLLANLEGYRRKLDADADVSARRKQAHDLLSAPGTRAAFDLSREPQRLRERYGTHRAGQACLLGRRLVEAGVPYVTVFFNTSVRGQDKTPDDTDSYGWDTHNDVFDALKDHLLPRFDSTFAALLEDLEQRGLLETTLVVCMGEFGRAPLVALEKTFAGSSPGRKHWAATYSIVMAGAGVRGGMVLGASDRRGAYPATTAYSPCDVAATVFSALGIDPEGHYRDALDRPFQTSEGRPIRAVYAG